MHNNLPTIKLEALNNLVLLGAWDLINLNENLLSNLTKFKFNLQQVVIIDATNITGFDLGGAYFIDKLSQKISLLGVSKFEFKFNAKDQAIFNKVKSIPIFKPEPLNPDLLESNPIINLGKSVYGLFKVATELISFLGYICISLFTIFKDRNGLHWPSVIDTIKNAGIHGILISSALCFLIGVNLTYQMSPQFVTYGANVYIVNFLGISLLREVTPLLTAIIVAGRTGSAITATIGTMKVQEEIDALRTMGISPIRRLVVPRLLGLLLALPVLTMLADVASMLGGMLVANSFLNVSYSLFLDRLQTYVSISNYSLGVIKSFAFAWIIAMVGSFCGFRVKANAESIGIQTTKSVVLSICLIIFVDAVFAIAFKNFF